MSRPMIFIGLYYITMECCELDSIVLILAQSIFKQQFINNHTVGRKNKVYGLLWRPIEIQSESGTRVSLGKMQLLCPICRSSVVGEYGTHSRKFKRVETFQCKNPDCKHLKKYKYGKQFVLTTSSNFQELILSQLKSFYEDLMIDGAKHKTIAKKYGISEA